MLEILDGGFHATIQDCGRPGYLATGMPPSGPMDRFALAISNILVGNDPGDPYLIGKNPGDAGIEVLFSGFRFRVLGDTVIAITGADLSPHINGSPAAMWTALRLRAGDVVSFDEVRAGARAYVAVAGGIDVPVMMGSRATNVRAFIGGVEGRTLRAGDILRTFPPKQPLGALAGRRLREDLIPVYSHHYIVRVILGPQDYLFTDDSVVTFLSYDWKLSPVSDRMGCRFIGPKLEFKPRPAYLVEQAGSDPSNIVDDAIPVGGIQVPGGLEPIVLHVDGPSLGGYAKIATVISADLGKIGQMQPFDTVRFEAVSVPEAVEALRQMEAVIAESSIVS